jgi:hypothetical protein
MCLILVRYQGVVVLSLRRAARERERGTGRGRERGREGGRETERKGDIAGETMHIRLACIDALMEAGRGGVAEEAWQRRRGRGDVAEEAWQRRRGRGGVARALAR